MCKGYVSCDVMLIHTHNKNQKRFTILGSKYGSAIIENSENCENSENSFPDGKIPRYENLFTREKSEYRFIAKSCLTGQKSADAAKTVFRMPKIRDMKIFLRVKI